MHDCYNCPLLNINESLRQNQYSIVVDKQNRTLSLLRNGKWFKSYPVAVGKPATPTPEGNFKIVNVAVNPGGPFGVRWLGLNAPGGDYGIHGTNNPSSIGKAVSNGCVRMYNDNILDLVKYAWVETEVKII